MKLIFISGPYRGPYMERVNNINKARRIAISLVRGGFYFICPHLNSAHFDDVVYRPAPPDSFYLDMYLDILKRCDAMIQLPGWKRSEGCQLEYSTAIGEKIPIFQSIKSIKEWANAMRGV